MISDHTCKSYYEALLEVRNVRIATAKGREAPDWQPFTESKICTCCASEFTWNSTSTSAAQAARDKHNCRRCGSLVCGPCSKQRIGLPDLGIEGLARVCDGCYYDLGMRGEQQSSPRGGRKGWKGGGGGVALARSYTNTADDGDGGNLGDEEGGGEGEVSDEILKEKYEAIREEIDRALGIISTSPSTLSSSSSTNNCNGSSTVGSRKTSTFGAGGGRSGTRRRTDSGRRKSSVVEEIVRTLEEMK